MAAQAVAGGLGIGVGLESIKTGSYDFYNYYYHFPKEFTEIIDNMLTHNSRSKIGISSISLNLGKNISGPDLGKHRFYWKPNSWFHYIYFEKRMTETGHYDYMCYVSPFQHATFMEAMSVIFASKEDQVRAISIDTSHSIPCPMYIERKYEEPYAYQTQGLDKIIKHYYETKNKKGHNVYNTKVLICGEKKAGKTWMGRLLKKKLELDKKQGTQLYDDFNPSSTGSNITRLILQNATVKTNIITLIDEIDTTYRTAIEDKVLNQYDTRLVHTQNKQTLNAMFEVISDKMFMMALYTTELSPHELYANESWRSFFRKGRVDLILHFIKNHESTTDDDKFICTVVDYEELQSFQI
jgi:hypothetical protein